MFVAVNDIDLRNSWVTRSACHDDSFKTKHLKIGPGVFEKWAQTVAAAAGKGTTRSFPHSVGRDKNCLPFSWSEEILSVSVDKITL